MTENYMKDRASLSSVADAYRQMVEPKTFEDTVQEELIESIIQDVEAYEIKDLLQVTTFNVVNEKPQQELSEISLHPNDIRKEFPNVWAQKDKRMNNILMALVNLHGYNDNLKSYKKNPKAFVDSLKKIGKNDASLKKAGLTKRNIGEDLQEGTWAVPDSLAKIKTLQDLLTKPLYIKTEKDSDKAWKKYASLVGDDGVADEWHVMTLNYSDKKEVGDARVPVIDFLKDWGFKVNGFKITHAPATYVSGMDDDEKSTRKVEEKDFDESDLQEGIFKNMWKKIKGKGKIRKPKGKDAKVTKISDLVKDLSGKSTKGKDFGKGIFKFEAKSKMGGSKLTGQEISVYFRKNPKAKSNPMVKKAVEIALDHGGAMNYAIDKIEKLKKGLSKNKEVEKALNRANFGENNQEIKPYYKGFELIMQEALNRKDQIKLAAFGKQLSGITGIKWDSGKEPEVAVDRLFGQVRKGKYSPASWEKIQKMVGLLDKIGVKLPSLKGFYMGFDPKTRKGIYHEEIKNIKEDIEEIVEAQTMSDADIKKIAAMTDRNDHNGSMMHLAKILKNKKAQEIMASLMKIHKSMGYMPGGGIEIRRELMKILFSDAKKKYRNYSDINSAF
jgi:hypothetical protein